MSMQDKLRAKFLVQFMETARERIALCQKSVSNDEAQEAHSAMHSLAGEASILGFDEISKIARSAEADAAAWQTGKNASRVKCGRTLRLISRALDALEGNKAEADPNAPARHEVLIIDDSEIVAAHMQETLEEAGMQVHCADAFELAVKQATQVSPNVILLDANIPDIDTAELVGALRSACSHSKIVLVSGLADEELAPLCETLNLDGYVSKQAGMDAVVQRVKKSLAEPRS